MSLINIKNSKGPKTDSCGTPGPVSLQDEKVPSTTTRCFLWSRYGTTGPELCSKLALKIHI